MVDNIAAREFRSRGRAASRFARRALCALAAVLAASGAAASGKAGMQIGAILPTSAPDAAHGEDIRNGMLLALKTWPGQSPPTLVVKDSACEPKKAAAAAQELIDAKVDVVVGGFCVLATVPRMMAEAMVPFISANAVRFAPAADSALQFGTVPQGMPASVGFKLRSESGLKVTAHSSCWIDYEQRVADGFDAALCPTLHIDNARWDEIAPTYAAAYRKPFTAAAARGYAAMQVALAGIKQIRAGSRPGQALKDAKEVSTVLGKIRWRDDGVVPEDAMQLILATRLPRLSARESSTLDEILKSKGCGCAKGTECASGKAWSSLPFVVPCSRGTVAAR
ncbi:ABC transporter substrate-binding protein [Piscinibacter sp. XHJ-5]|uniref:ABC transporter substrate-binding protein n=1 Tax=Piscinibacter sp. XHJ-5 TaxID=3037797 RepID=UPI002452F6B9|nr:ABC transporter substrate-binding protein [Piscinibacter sp. XHJ-5]